MTSRRQIVLLAGGLKGMGLEANCMIGATRVTLPGTNLSEYANLSIQNAPQELPEGRYDLTFKGRTVPVQKRNGFWLAA